MFSRQVQRLTSVLYYFNYRGVSRARMLHKRFARPRHNSRFACDSPAISGQSHEGANRASVR